MEQKINTKSLIEAVLMAGIITIISISTSYILLFYIIVLPILVALI